jgi:hypothetical protein
MIPQRSLSLLSNRLARAGGRRIPEAVLERDYCLAWFLVGLSRAPLRELLAFKGGTAPANDLADLPNAPNRSQPSAANGQKLLATFLQAPRSTRSTPSDGSTFTRNLRLLLLRGGRDLNPRPPA